MGIMVTDFKLDLNLKYLDDKKIFPNMIVCISNDHSLVSSTLVV